MKIMMTLIGIVELPITMLPNVIRTQVAPEKSTVIVVMVKYVFQFSTVICLAWIHLTGDVGLPILMPPNVPMDPVAQGKQTANALGLNDVFLSSIVVVMMPMMTIMPTMMPLIGTVELPIMMLPNAMRIQPAQGKLTAIVVMVKNVFQFSTVKKNPKIHLTGDVDQPILMPLNVLMDPVAQGEQTANVLMTSLAGPQYRAFLIKNQMMLESTGLIGAVDLPILRLLDVLKVSVAQVFQIMSVLTDTASQLLCVKVMKNRTTYVDPLNQKLIGALQALYVQEDRIVSVMKERNALKLIHA